jgi:hypothetical protein
MDVRLPDGTVIQNVPDGMTKADLITKLKGNGYDTSGLDPAVAAGQVINKSIDSIPRQLGLTARYGIEGLANTAQLVSEPIRAITDRLGGSVGKTKPAGALASGFADWMGLPKPETPTERVVGDASRLVAGTAMTMGAGNLAQKGGEIAKNLGGFFTQNPISQISSAAGAGLAGGASREAGGSETGQVLASVAGGIGGASLAGLGQGLVTQANKLKNVLMSPQQMDMKISEVLQKSGVDYSQVPERTRQALRAEMAGSLKAGKELDPGAVSRLLDFQQNGLTPTRGMLTLDPVQITREQNLAKIGANSSDGSLQGLARVQNQNNSRLIANMNDAGAGSGNMMGAGASSIGAIQSQDAAQGAAVTGLYNTARAMPGGNTQLDRAGVINNIYSALGKENKLAFLPENVSNMLDTISKGVVRVGGQEHAVPFDANALDNLMTTIATAQRGTSDGNVKAALSIVRKALDASPITPIKPTFGGNQLVTQPLAQAMQQADGQAGAFMDAIRQAKGAAAQRFSWQESGRPIEAALGGAQPDNFIKQFVINGTVKDARDLAANAPIEPIKNALVAHLKEKALNGAADEVGKFSQSAFNKALKDLGPKLDIFFTKSEIDQLSSMGRAASYMQHQPVGSAVNNSNSGALLFGRGMDLLDKIPMAGPWIAPPIRNIQVSMGNRAAQNVAQSLLQKQPQQPFINGLLAPGVAMGGLLAAPTSP